ncbi:energy-coupling factor ABC transporter permease [Luteococcus sanguinis]|uniref:Energy-coupling factor ABC transporter permease n=1 Tax=Luteococcus sanguinis TaxID=174038 RepID=A0ABW1X4W8_9ACTN
MHIPDGFLDAPVCLVTAAGSLAAVTMALRGCRRELDDRAAPLAGLVAAFVFAAQMVNFPVAAGTSGHLLGGALAVALVGPWTAMLCLTVVLAVQCLLFADGGITALGANTWNMAVVGVLIAWAVMTVLARVLPRTRMTVLATVALAGLASVLAAAGSFVALYALGGTVDVPLGTVLGAMLGVHTLIGLGEAAITALVVSGLLALRPDLVWAARGLVADRTPVLRDAAEVSA